MFDALDEVETQYYDTLAFELHQLRRDTDNIIIITSRIQNYRGDFCTDFLQYSLTPLSNKKITELLEKYSNGQMKMHISQIPKSILEVIRTPLFLKMFVTISKNEDTYKNPANRAMLFEMYLTKKISLLFDTPYDEIYVKRILGEYAIYSYENGDCTEKFLEIINKNCEGNSREKVFDLIWKTGIIFNGLQGIKYFHKSVQEFFVALHLSAFDSDKLSDWLEQNVQKDKYNEVICYLTGIISNHQKQNDVLDFLEIRNFKLYIKALEARRNFEKSEQELNIEYAKKFYAQILKTYDNIIRTYFYNICHAFDGYKYDKNEKDRICIKGGISFTNESISLVIYSGTPEEEQLNVTISSENKTHIILANGKEIPFTSSVFTIGKLHERYYDLGLLSYGFDSAREIAIDIIKKQINEIIKNKAAFDIDIEVLLVERIENILKKIKISNGENSNYEQLSLYTNSISEIINKITLADNYNQEMDSALIFCKIIELKTDNVDPYLDVKPDKEPEDDNYIIGKYELYSNEQLVEKVKKILDLSQKATRKIVTEIILGLSAIRPNTRMVGIVHRNDEDAGVEYIEVKIESGEENEPIIEFMEEAIEMYPELDEYYLNKLRMIGKSEQDIISRTSSVLERYFGDDVFHQIIYKNIKDLFVKLFGGLLH